MRRQYLLCPDLLGTYHPNAPGIDTFDMIGHLSQCLSPVAVFKSYHNTQIQCNSSYSLTQNVTEGSWFTQMKMLPREPWLSMIR